MSKVEIEKDFHKLIHNGVFGKFSENIRDRFVKDFIKKCEDAKNIKQQSKLTFNGNKKSYIDYSSYTFKQNEVTLDEPIFVGFAILELS